MKKEEENEVEGEVGREEGGGEEKVEKMEKMEKEDKEKEEKYEYDQSCNERSSPGFLAPSQARFHMSLFYFAMGHHTRQPVPLGRRRRRRSTRQRQHTMTKAETH